MSDSPENKSDAENKPETPAPEEKGRQELSIRKVTPEEAAAQTPSRPNSEDDTGRARVMAPSGQPGQRLLFTPVIDIYNTEDGLVLRADLPGVCVERLDLQIGDNKLTLFGRVAENLPEGARPLHREYQVGDFYRSFILSDEVAYDRIAAKMNAGVLEITLPIIPRAQPRKIHVQTE